MKELYSNITVNPGVQFGKPVIAGTRVPVEVIIGHVAAGDAIEDIAKEYNVTKEDVQTALKYAAKIIGEETLIYGSAFSH